MIRKSESAINSYLKRLNSKRSKKQIVKVGSAVALNLFLLFNGADGTDITEIAVDSVKKYDTLRRKIVRDKKDNIEHDMGRIEGYADIIDEWIELKQKPTEIIFSENEFYISNPLNYMNPLEKGI